MRRWGTRGRWGKKFPFLGKKERFQKKGELRGKMEAGSSKKGGER